MDKELEGVIWVIKKRFQRSSKWKPKLRNKEFDFKKNKDVPQKEDRPTKCILKICSLLANSTSNGMQ